MVWRRLAILVEYGRVEMGLSTAVVNPAGTLIAEFSPVEQVVLVGGYGKQ
jgi:hypothetical protein